MTWDDDDRGWRTVAESNVLRIAILALLVLAGSWQVFPPVRAAFARVSTALEMGQ